MSHLFSGLDRTTFGWTFFCPITGNLRPKRTDLNRNQRKDCILAVFYSPMCVRAAYTHLPRGSKQPKSETREMNRRTVAGVQRVAEGKRKRLDFPPPVEKESRRFSPVPNPPEDQVSSLGSPPRTALTLSSGSPRFSSAILFSIVFVWRFFSGDCYFQNFCSLSSQTTTTATAMTKNQETAVPSIPEYCYDRDSEKKINRLYGAHRLLLPGGTTKTSAFRPCHSSLIFRSANSLRLVTFGLPGSLESLRISHFFTTFRSTVECCMTAQHSQNVWLIFSIIDRPNDDDETLLVDFFATHSKHWCVRVLHTCMQVWELALTASFVSRSPLHFAAVSNPDAHLAVPVPEPFEWARASSENSFVVFPSCTDWAVGGWRTTCDAPFWRLCCAAANLPLCWCHAYRWDLLRGQYTIFCALFKLECFFFNNWPIISIIGFNNS